MKKLMKNSAFQSLLASIICILLGLLIGFIVLLFINPSGAGQAIIAIIKNFFNYSSDALRIKNLGNTLVKTAPLLMCALSILFCYKVGLFNIGAAGQYVAGSCACLFCGLGLKWNWFACIIAAIAAGAVFGAITGILKAYCNVNEVISGIMLNWIGLYLANMILSNVKEPTSPYTFQMKNFGRQALLPTAGLNKIFNVDYVTIAIPLAVIIAIIVKIVLEKTKFGFELKATGGNKNAAKYCGMAEKRNIILTLVIGGGLAGLAGAFMYQTGFEQWQCMASSVPAMGFNGIAAAFLGGLDPIGTIFSSFFIQHITAGGSFVDKALYCTQISDLISAIIIYLCGFVLFIKYAMNKAIAKREEREMKRAAAQKTVENTLGGDE